MKGLNSFPLMIPNLMHFIFATGLILVLSCGKDHSTNLATINGSSIKMNVFIPRYTSFLNKTHQNDNLRNRYAFLNSMIDERLILDHAKKEGINDAPNINFEKDKIYKQLLLNEYHDRKIIQEMIISDVELRRLFKHSKTRLHLRHLYAPSITEIRYIEEKIRSGFEWGTIAIECFQDSILRESGGDIGWHGMGDLDPAFEIVAFELKDGEISSPIKTRRGYSIIQVLEREKDLLLTEQDYQLNRDWLKKMAIRYRTIPLMRKFTDKVVEDLDITFDERGLDRLLDEINTYYESGNRNDRSKVLTSTFGKWSVEDCILEIASLSERQFEKIHSIKTLKEVLSGILARVKMIEDAESLELHRSKSFQNTLSQEYVSLILEKMTRGINERSNEINWQEEYFKVRDKIALGSEILIDSTRLRGFPMVMETVL